MAEKYTVATSMPTGKSDPTFGVEYMVKFAENEGTFKLWYKTPPVEGFVQEGTIDGWKFTKAKKEYNPGGNTSQAGAATSESARTPISSKPPYKDNSDGMRQGMCMNNAANYINATNNTKVLKPEEWAELVYNHASALYSLGDLTALPIITEEEIDASANVAAVFGVNK